VELHADLHARDPRPRRAVHYATGASPADNFRRKNEVLNEWCAKVGRDPRAIERTVAINPKDLADAERYAEAGADHLIVMMGAPFRLDAIERFLASR